MQISWTIEGEVQLSRRLRGVGEGVKNWQPAFKDASDELKKVFSNDVFETQGRAIGVTWPPLSPSTLRDKTRRGFGGKGPLERSGAMRRGFQSVAKTDYAKVWNSLAYFKYHQSNKPRTKIPRRVMMRLGNAQREMVVRTFQRYFKELMQHHGAIS
jgi:phage gpG-like protein